jgi:two-component system, chemotaxis family, chemotaxis protein CheY
MKMAKTILIVDDSASLRQVVRMSLESNGFNVIDAEDGEKALAHLDGKTVDLIVCDVNMPRMGGIEFVSKAKLKPQYKFTPILMLTTESSEDKKNLGRSAGASAWMVKPFAPSQLLKAAQKLTT